MPHFRNSYVKLSSPCLKCSSSQENFSPPVTLSLPEWQDYVATGQNTFPGDAIVPGGTSENGAVYQGHVRQNPFTAFLPPEGSEEPHENPSPYWYY
jgi:hypothetical protein